MRDHLILGLLILGFWASAAGALGHHAALACLGWLAIVAGGVLAAT